MLFGTGAIYRRRRYSQVRWTLVVYEFLDNDQFSNLDTLMLQLAPGQCLLSLDAGGIEGKPRGDMAKVRLATAPVERKSRSLFVLPPCVAAEGDA